VYPVKIIALESVKIATRFWLFVGMHAVSGDAQPCVYCLGVQYHTAVRTYQSGRDDGLARHSQRPSGSVPSLLPNT